MNVRLPSHADLSVFFFLLIGEVARNEDIYRARYNHLNHSFHNYLRISRILKALGEFGFERFKIHWIELFIEEIFEHGLLRNTLSSLQNFWVPTLRHREERVAMKNKIHAHLKQPDTDDEGDDMGDNEDMKDLPSPPMANGTARADASTAGSEDSSTEDPSDDEETSSKENGENSDSVEVAKKKYPKKERGDEDKKEKAEEHKAESQSEDRAAHLSAATSSSSRDGISVEAVATSSVAPASDIAGASSRTTPVTISAKSSFSEKSRSRRPSVGGNNELASSEDEEDRDDSGKKALVTSSADPVASELSSALGKVTLGSTNMAGSSSSDCDSNLSASEDLPDKKPVASSDEPSSTKKSRSSSSSKPKKSKRVEQAL